MPYQPGSWQYWKQKTKTEQWPRAPACWPNEKIGPWAANKSSFLSSESVHYHVQYRRKVARIHWTEIDIAFRFEEDRFQGCMLKEGRSPEGKESEAEVPLQVQWFLIRALTVGNITVFYGGFVGGCSFVLKTKYTGHKIQTGYTTKHPETYPSTQHQTPKHRLLSAGVNITEPALTAVAFSKKTGGYLGCGVGQRRKRI